MPIDYRENVVFLHTFGCADEKSEKIRLAYFSALFQHQFVRADVKNPKPAKSYKQEKEACLDLLIQRRGSPAAGSADQGAGQAV